jgi:hypothetical protein
MRGEERGVTKQHEKGRHQDAASTHRQPHTHTHLSVNKKQKDETRRGNAKNKKREEEGQLPSF